LPATPPEPLPTPEHIERFLTFDLNQSAFEGGPLPFRRRSVRIVVSDFLFPARRRRADLAAGP
jgi:hypothetical protein